MYGVVLLAHLLAATIWTGGHLVLALSILPTVLKQKDIVYLSRFESGFERVGIPALIVQVSSGLWLAHQRLPDVAAWLDFTNPAARPIALKLTLLAATVLLAVDARLRIIPNLHEGNLRALAWHVVPVTVIAVLFVVVGLSFRTGWLGL